MKLQASSRSARTRSIRLLAIAFIAATASAAAAADEAQKPKPSRKPGQAACGTERLALQSAHPAVAAAVGKTTLGRIDQAARAHGRKPAALVCRSA